MVDREEGQARAGAPWHLVLNSLSAIAQETSGRGQAQKDVREAAIKLLGARLGPIGGHHDQLSDRLCRPGPCAR